MSGYQKGWIERRVRKLIPLSYWWLLAIRGGIALLFGSAIAAWPHQTPPVFGSLFGMATLLDGGIVVINARQERRLSSSSWLLLRVEGSIGIILGTLLCASPGMNATIVRYSIAGWTIIKGSIEARVVVSLRPILPMVWTQAFAGIVSLQCGLLLILLPGAEMASLAWCIGVYLLVTGILLLIRAFRFWKMRSE